MIDWANVVLMLVHRLRRWPKANVVLMLVQRLRRWPNIKTTSVKCVMFAGIYLYLTISKLR